MNYLNALYEEAETSGIHIFFRDLRKRKAFCVRWESDHYVAIDKSKLKSEREEKSAVAEEMAHCQYGLMYRLEDYNNPLRLLNARKAETLAKRYAAKKIVPLDKLKEALRTYDDIYDVCEELDVDLSTLETAINSYDLEGVL